MLNMKWTLSAGLLAAFAMTAPQAGAQTPNYRGSITLPVEARFGNTVLEPGNYTVSTLDGDKGIRIAGENKTVSILAAGSDLRPATDHGKIVLVNAGGMYALKTLESGTMGRSLNFVVGKGHGNSERAGVTPQSQTVEIGLQ